MLNKYRTKAMEQKELLRNFLIRGEVNAETAALIKQKIFEACKMNIQESKDRVLWSNWINAKNKPTRFAMIKIDEVLNELGYPKLYEQC